MQRRIFHPFQWYDSRLLNVTLCPLVHEVHGLIQQNITHVIHLLTKSSPSYLCHVTFYSTIDVRLLPVAQFFYCQWSI